MNNPDPSIDPRANATPAQELRGIGGSPGVAVGPVVVLHSRLPEIPVRRVPLAEAAAEWDRYQVALSAARSQLRELRHHLDTQTVNGEAAILDAHLMVLDDAQLNRRIQRQIADHHRNAEWAVSEVVNAYTGRLAESREAYLAERVDDLTDVARRLIRNLMGVPHKPPSDWPHPCLVVAENLSPSETISMPRDRVLGFALDHGSYTSHAALIARALEIPAVFGLGDLSRRVHSGDVLAIDGHQGMVFVNPSARDLRRLHGVAAARQDVLRRLAGLRDEPALMPDGRRIGLLANIEKVDEIGSIGAHGAEGVGLFRTEYLWLAGGRPLGEEEQTTHYLNAVRALGGLPLTVRVFDLGGDKFMGHVGLERESNPFLGMRSIRYLLRHPDVFKAQLRAILRAAAEGDVRILYPMISDVAELRRANELLALCRREVAADYGGREPDLPVGVMIEVPSAALTANLLADHADFFSIGTNDLTQYTMVADRINEQVVHLYQPAHPAVLSLMNTAIRAAVNNSMPVGVCGEMAADPALALLLVGMGADSLSMAPSSLPVVKDALRKTPLSVAQALASEALAARSAGAVLKLCRDTLTRYAPELLAIA